MDIARRSIALAVSTAAVVALVASPACNKPRKRVLTKEQNVQIQNAVMKEAPKPQIEVGAILDGKLKLIGLDVKPREAKVGGHIDVDYYWEVLEPASENDWKIFVHFEVPGQKRSVHDHHGVGELYPIRKWNKGEIVKDSQRIPIGNDFPNGEARIYVGVFDATAWAERNENIRMKVTNRDQVKVPVEPDERIVAATVKLTGGKAKGKAPARGADRKDTAPRRYTAHKSAEAITLDGKLSEPAWRKARPTRPFVTPDGGRVDPKFLSQARLTWDDTNLYVGFTVRDDDIWNDQKGRDATLWKQDVVEVYLDPGADGKDYVELQFSPAGEIFDAKFDTRRQPKWEEAVKALNMEGLAVKVEARGSVNKRDDKVSDRSWTAEIAIPWAQLPGVSGAPAGQTWAVNLYRIDAGSPGKQNVFAAWAPAGGDFHNLGGFGKVTFDAEPAPDRAKSRVPSRRGTDPRVRPMRLPKGGVMPVKRQPPGGAEAKPAADDKKAPADDKKAPTAHKKAPAADKKAPAEKKAPAAKKTDDESPK